MLKYKETKLRPLLLEDIDNVMSWVNDPEVVGRYAYFNEPFTREEELRWLEEKLKSPNDRFYAIENQTGAYLGNIAIEKIHWPSKNGALSITIGNKKERGKGHGQRAINLILYIAFKKLKLHKVYLSVAEDNSIGIHIYNKLGFIKEGTLRDHYVIDGNYVDMFFMSILEDEFRKIHNIE
ncbi:MAG: GNAT family N-acetyltransferase [Promethearchaeota archaeon]